MDTRSELCSEERRVSRPSVIDRLVVLLKRLGGAALVGMMILTCIDVVTRYFGYPIFGMVEIVSFLATILLACAMPLTHVEKGHVGVDLLVRRLPTRSQTVIDAITSLLGAVLFGIVSWQMFLYGGTIKRSGEVSMSLEFPTYVFVYVVAVAFAALSLVILVEFLENTRKAVRS